MHRINRWHLPDCFHFSNQDIARGLPVYVAPKSIIKQTVWLFTEIDSSAVGKRISIQRQRQGLVTSTHYFSLVDPQGVEMQFIAIKRRILLKHTVYI